MMFFGLQVREAQVLRVLSLLQQHQHTSADAIVPGQRKTAKFQEIPRTSGHSHVGLCFLTLCFSIAI